MNLIEENIIYTKNSFATRIIMAAGCTNVYQTIIETIVYNSIKPAA